MKEVQRLFLAQARSTYKVYQFLKKVTSIHHCHPLHSLQMATELLAKASAWRNSRPRKSHKALVGFLRQLSSNSKAQKMLGYKGQTEHWKQTIRKMLAIAEVLEELAPALTDGPNPEYPWPEEEPTETPVEYEFPIWKELTKDTSGRSFIAFLDDLFEQAEAYL